MSSVDILNVTKAYGEVLALDDVTVSFAEKEFFSLLGPSGSGKTTLLRAIAGFVQPTSGRILIGGTDISRVPTHKRDIGMVFQNYALFPHMTVGDNIAFPLNVRGIAAAEIRRRVGEVLDLVQLGGMEARRPRQLSGGQQQRIALARALVSRPRVLLLDEPLGALDKNLRMQMQIELKRIQREVGITTVLVTHDQEEALTLSDRIAIVHRGRIIQLGTPEGIYEKPTTMFSAEFFGHTNFFRGRVRDGAVQLADGVVLQTRDALPASGDEVTLTVRPEKFVIGDQAAVAADDVNRLEGVVVQPIYQGAAVTYQVDCKGLMVTVCQQNREARIFAPGQPVTLSWLPQHSIVVNG